ATNIRCMRIDDCRCLSDKAFSEAVRNLPKLEKVSISLCNSYLSKDSLEALGRSCPLLKSLLCVGSRL
ncbi:F-box protein, partial [Trifolium medium]|nr:F-box protein [Trifolium medium]